MGVELRKYTKKMVKRIGLEPYINKDSRHTCPSCGKKDSFSRFIDLTTGEYVGDEFGRCNRETSCGYQNSPTSGDIKGDLFVSSSKIQSKFKVDNSYMNVIPQATVMESLMGNTRLPNYFGTFLATIYPVADVILALQKYSVGTSDLWEGSTIFWQVDHEYDVRTGKIMLYDKDTGKRVKEPFNHINWVHSLTKQDYNLKQCLFGAHLLNDDCDTYHIVESEKTAIICYLENPSARWMATGGLQNLRRELFMPFKDKKLIFYPDKGKAWTLWAEKLKSKFSDFNIVISKALEITDLEEGDDLGDMIIDKHNKKA